MDLDTMLGEVSQREKGKYDICDISNLKKNKWYKWSYRQNINRSINIENKSVVTKEAGRGIIWD